MHDLLSPFDNRGSLLFYNIGISVPVDCELDSQYIGRIGKGSHEALVPDWTVTPEEVLIRHTKLIYNRVPCARSYIYMFRDTLVLLPKTLDLFVRRRTWLVLDTTSPTCPSFQLDNLISASHRK